MINIHNPRNRAALFGAIGGFLGWFLSQIFWGTPSSFFGAVVVGTMAGLGIGAILGVSEGLTAASGSLLKRGLFAGVGAGLLGGTVGAFVGQLGFVILSGNSAKAATESGTRETVFSTDVSERLAAAGAKKGEIEISLIWENSNDLDLHVIDPDGERIFFQQRESRSGGELDIDRNASCASDITTKPIEHVVWTGESAPNGNYKVAVHHFQNCGASDPTSYRVEVKIGNEIIKNHSGKLSFDTPVTSVEQLDLIPTIFEFSYPLKTSVPVKKSGSNFSAIVARLLGWLVFGLLVGCAEGVKRKSQTAMVNAAIGGTIGGGVGGILFQFVASAGLPDSISRLVGFVILGACIGLLIAIVEQLRSSCLVIENGRFAGREIAIDRPLMRIGRNDALEVYIGGDRSIAPHHVTIEQQSGALQLKAAECEFQINGVPKPQANLNHGDRIVLGETILVVRSQSRGSQAASTTAPQPQAPLSQPGNSEKASSRPIPPPPRKSPMPPPPVSTQSKPAVEPKHPAVSREPAAPAAKPKLPPPPKKRS